MGLPIIKKTQSCSCRTLLNPKHLFPKTSQHHSVSWPKRLSVKITASKRSAPNCSDTRRYLRQNILAKYGLF